MILDHFYPVFTQKSVFIKKHVSLFKEDIFNE